MSQNPYESPTGEQAAAQGRQPANRTWRVIRLIAILALIYTGGAAFVGAYAPRMNWQPKRVRLYSTLAGISLIAAIGSAVAISRGRKPK